ncbi:MAG: neutral/alkaline non-lysosomal ceramidase N-terminal domain-containing protein [Verrucomicrobiales bacterium]|nr:neutral/alkaline non-lysosomal ceramidase N-terminal domain-containing protein [Verrucomicrobiales bacterium]
MKRAFRLLVRLALVLVAVLALAAVVSLDRVDYRPYFREPYYAQTAERLRAHLGTNRLARGPLLAGFGSARLTPTIGAAQDNPARGEFRAMPLAGYGDRRGKPATGVRDELFVKAVALRVGDLTGVMVGTDALIVPREVTALVAERLAREPGLARERVYLSATHTHCSLGAWGEGPVAEAFAGEFQPGAREWFADRIVTAVRAALADLQPAALGHGRFDAPEFVRNRVVGQLGRVDPEFTFLVVRRADGQTAVLGAFAAHATILGGDVMEFSGDYPGAWQRAVEQATGGMAVFLAGGVGSHSPVPGERGFAGVERMGRALAGMVLERLPAVALTNFVTFGIAGVEVSLPPLNWRVTDALRMRPWVARRLLGSGDRTFLQVFRVQDVLWASTPCDYSGELALAHKDALRARGFDAVITSFNGDYVGYVIPSRYYHLGGYEPQLMSFFGPYVPDYFDELLRTMMLALARN